MSKSRRKVLGSDKSKSAWKKISGMSERASFGVTAAEGDEGCGNDDCGDGCGDNVQKESDRTEETTRTQTTPCQVEGIGSEAGSVVSA